MILWELLYQRKHHLVPRFSVPELLHHWPYKGHLLDQFAHLERTPNKIFLIMPSTMEFTPWGGSPCSPSGPWCSASSLQYQPFLTCQQLSMGSRYILHGSNLDTDGNYPNLCRTVLHDPQLTSHSTESRSRIIREYEQTRLHLLILILGTNDSSKIFSSPYISSDSSTTSS